LPTPPSRAEARRPLGRSVGRCPPPRRRRRRLRCRAHFPLPCPVRRRPLSPSPALPYLAGNVVDCQCLNYRPASSNDTERTDGHKQLRSVASPGNKKQSRTRAYTRRETDRHRGKDREREKDEDRSRPTSLRNTLQQ